MTNRVLTQRELNRALLARQMLLQRETITPLEAVERLAGLQAQIPNPPYIGLWTRLASFQRDDLTTLMAQRQVVRAALMRSTLHLATAADHQCFRPTLQPALERALSAFFGRWTKGVDVATLVAAAKPFVEEAPRSTGDLRTLLAELEPERDATALAYAVRTHLPLVQVPPGGTWGSGSIASYTTADTWLGPLDPPDLRGLLHRYLAAFGPATVMDFQAWSGMTRLANALKPYTDELRVFQNEAGKTLLDLPDAPLPDPDTPALPRFVPEYDNLIISHADRTRIIADADRPKVLLSSARVRATILVDGFVQGVWAIKRTKQQATLVVEPFAPLAGDVRDALEEEGRRLLRFVADDAGEFVVQFDV